jgi:dephospho-CoA kinase
MKSIIIVGLSGVGKTSAGEYLRGTAGAVHIEASKYMRQMWEDSPSQETLQTFAANSLAIDPALVAKQVLHDCNRLGVENLVVTGFRSPVEVRTIQRASQSSAVLLLSADMASRLNRLQKRRRQGDPLDEGQLRALDDLHLAMGLEIIFEKCDDVLINDGSQARLRKELRNLALMAFADENLHFNVDQSGNHRGSKIRPTKTDRARSLSGR